MSKEWQLVLHEPTLRFLLACRASERRQVLQILDQLQADPYKEPSHWEKDASGRPHRLWVTKPWVFTYWLDDLVKELRVLRIERF